ncbi:MAG: helix-turn-helix domain-containing protein [Phycisphaerales bacterium]|nr:helix-turn-helix domain-containing protein [Phycisphaerales bacterium]
MTTHAEPKRRRGRPPAAQLANPDLPYTMKLPDGRTLYVEVPGRWVTADRDNKPAFLPGAVDFLDRVRALAVTLDRPPGPGFITALREALGLTQKEFGEELGVDKMTVSRWERGALKPSDESLAALDDLRRRAVRRGVTIPA